MSSEHGAQTLPVSSWGGKKKRIVYSTVLALAVAVAALIGLFRSTPSRGAVRQNPKDGLRYVWIPEGDFEQGCSKFDGECTADEKPAHDVRLLKGFWIGQSEVTVGAYRKFAAAARRSMPPEATFGGRPLNAGWSDVRMPIVNVDWQDSKNYCEWIGGRLPTEAQWEYAARAGSTAPLYGKPAEIAWYGDNAGTGPLDTTTLLKADPPGFLYHLSRNGNSFHEVGAKAPNQYGLYDMLGNVWEWTADWYGDQYYRAFEGTDPTGPRNGDTRVLRGGSWTNSPNSIRVSVRGHRPPGTRSIDTGFRCVW